MAHAFFVTIRSMRIYILVLLILLTACSTKAIQDKQTTPSPTALPFATATLRPTFTPRPSATLLPPTLAPTIAPVNGTLSTQVNVRSIPDKNANSLGLLVYGTRVQIIGKDTSGTWWQIIYPTNSNSTAWVNASFVNVSQDDVDKIPVINIEVTETPNVPHLPNVTGVPSTQALTATVPPRTAKVLTQINVRAGPGQSFPTLGLLEANAIVNPMGRNQNNSWIQILFDKGTDGKGWVAAAYLNGVDLTGLPYFDGHGNQISDGSLSSSPGLLTLTPTAFSPAAADGDSESKPSIQMQFSPDGAREFTYSGDVSSPNGDTTDWIAFTPYEPTNQSTYVYLKLSCTGNGGITGVLDKDGTAVPETKVIVCGNYDLAMKVQGGAGYILVLTADGSNGPLRYTQYTLSIKSTR